MMEGMKWVLKPEFSNETTERLRDIFILWQNMEILGIRNTALIL